MSTLVEYYENNKHRPWNEWLEVVSVFPRPGKQGFVGLMRSKDPLNGNKSKPSLIYVFKVSRYINHLINHEHAVMSSLNDIASYCPHFCRSIGYITAMIDPRKSKGENPFQIDCKYPIEKEVLLMEYLENSFKLYNFITSKESTEKAIYSLVKQVMASVSIAQNKKDFTHYDLHSNNIMVRECDPNLVFLYVLNDEYQFCVPSYGYYATIIDFGFAFSKDLNKGSAWPSLKFTDSGFMSDRFDPIADPKLFLVTVSDEIRHSKRTNLSKALLTITKNFFSKLNIDWNSGWDQDTDECVVDEVLKKLEKCKKISSTLEKNEYYCIDIIQTLIELPLKHRSKHNITLSYKTFASEFSKLEKVIGSEYYSLYILKGLVDSARQVKNTYIKGDRKEAVDYFRSSILERIDSIASYCIPKDVHYEKMLCSLYCLAKDIEGILYDSIKAQMKMKIKAYSKLPITNIDEMSTILHLNLPETYIFTEQSKIMVIDCVSEKSEMKSLNKEQCEKLNDLKSVYWGTELFSIFSN